MDQPIIAGRKSIKLELEPGSYWWCACGRSQNQPWCDGSHKGTSITPVEFVAEEKRIYSMCTCKQSAKGPICDGAHKLLPEE